MRQSRFYRTFGIAALAGIGGGTLFTPYFKASGMEPKLAIGTSAAIGLPVSLAGALAMVGRDGVYRVSNGLQSGIKNKEWPSHPEASSRRSKINLAISLPLGVLSARRLPAFSLVMVLHIVGVCPRLFLLARGRFGQQFR
jgi:hypothetical protein